MVEGKPPCFETRVDFLEWKRLAVGSGRTGLDQYCFDCTPDYQRVMLKIFKCSHPETVFVEIPDEDGEMTTVGIRADRSY